MANENNKKVPCGGFELGDSLVINDGKLDLVKGGGSITVDSELSNTSENPVQNKVIRAALDAKLDVFEVTFLMNGETGKTSVDRTFDEIKTAYGSGVYVLAKYVVFFGNIRIIKGFSATCNYVPANEIIYFTFAFGDYGNEVAYNYGDVTIGSISIDSNNNIVVNDSDSYIGNMVLSGSLIISSSTSGSSKKFKITVDDSGTISATEVTS